jgi:cyclohexanecarboxyl-CoA dehydrogenase
MGALGLLGVDLPEEVGGLGVDAVTTGLIAEELAYGDFNISAVPFGISLIAAILMRHAKPEVVQEWVPRMTRGDAVVAICLTEPRGGSDASKLQLRAKRDGDDWVLNGEKTSITFADRADAYLVFARTGTPESGAKGVSAFFFPYEGTKGISRTCFDDLGSHIIGRGSVFLDDVRVPASHMVGTEGKGFTQVMQGFDYSRPDRPAVLRRRPGVARRAWAYTKEREAFGKPIGHFQGVSFRRRG